MGIEIGEGAGERGVYGGAASDSTSRFVTGAVTVRAITAHARTHMHLQASASAAAN